MDDFINGLEKYSTERAKQQRMRRQDKFKIEFLAVRKDIERAIAAGYSLYNIWGYLKKLGRINSSYETFRRRVHLTIQEENESRAALAAKAEQPDQSQATPKKGGRKKTGKESNKQPEKPKMAGFNYDSQPNKEDLI